MNIKSACFKKRHFFFFLIPALFVFAYWIKIQIGINYFDSFSIGSYFPFKYLRNHVIVSPKPGILLEENFDKKRIYATWAKLWMREAGTVTKELSSDGINGSKCLLIKNSGNGSWAYSHNKRVQVKNGDIFYFKGDVNIKGENLFSYICVAAFDKNQKAISWGLFKETVNRTGAWIIVEKQFNISDDVIKYITFKLVGSGNGEFQFDNITFRKIM